MTASKVSVPETLEEALSPEWLTAALSQRYPGLRIIDVEPGPIVSRVSTNARFRIIADGPLPDGLPADLCVKGYFYEKNSHRAAVPETLFYRELAEATGVRTLQSVYADLDPDTEHGVLITADVEAEGGRFLDGRSKYTPDQTAQSLTELAKLHASTWGGAQFADKQWLRPRMADTLLGRGFKEINGNFEGPIGAGVPAEVRDAQRLVDAYTQLCEQVKAQPTCVMHGDTHVGNVYIAGDGRPAWLDWQLVQLGTWWVDVGYHIASSLTVDERRATEQDLLRHYLQELKANGVEPPSWDEAWLSMQRGLVHGFFLWGITLKVAPPVTASLLQRLGTAAADHDSLGAVARA